MGILEDLDPSLNEQEKTKPRGILEDLDPSISTLTNKLLSNQPQLQDKNTPVIDPYLTNQEPAKLSALIKASFVDDPKGKIEIFAKSRGMSSDRYRIIDDTIMYHGSDGKWYPETKRSLGGKVKGFVGGNAGFMLPELGAAVGAGGGPIPAAILAAGGESARRMIGEKISGIKNTPLSNLIGVGVTGLAGGLGELVGRGAVRGVNRLGANRGGRLAVQAGRTRELINSQKSKEIRQLAKDMGIDLYAPQTTGSRALTDKFNLLGDLPESAPIIQQARKRQMEQIDGAVYDFLNYITPDEVPATQAGQAVAEAAKGGLQQLKRARTRIAEPLYKQVENVNGIDISPTLGIIDDMLSKTKPGLADHKALTRIKGMLTRKEKMPNGGVVTQAEDRLVILDKVKKDINAQWKADPKNAPQKETQKELNDVLNSMLENIDKQVPAYGEARKLYSNLSPPIEKVQKGKIGELAKLDNDKGFADVSRRLFDSVNTRPEAIPGVKKMITSQDPKAWDAALKNYLQDTFEKTKLSAGGVDVTTNIGGNFFKRTWGNPAQRKVFKEAMSPEQFSYFEKLSTVLDRAGMILRKESTTAPRQEMLNEITGGTTVRAVKLLKPMRTIEQALGEQLVRTRLGQNSKALAEAMVSKTGIDRLEKMWQLSPKSRKLIPMLSSFMTTLLVGNELKQAH